jgi:P2 family phage contractile tail tube protein
MIPDKVNDARVYYENNALLGVASIELPDLEYVTEKLDPFGIAGEPEVPNIGHFKDLTAKVKFRTIYEDLTKLAEPKNHQLTVYADIQFFNNVSGEFEHKQLRIVLKGIPKKAPIGKLEKGKPQEQEYEFSVNYIKAELDGREVLEIDILNYICKINGTDYLSQVRQNLGMA